MPQCARNLLAPMLAATLSLAGLGLASAQEPEWRHATALTGEPRYPEGFAHFDYVNADAPKGGRVRLADEGGFDTFNLILPKGNQAPGLGYLYEQLMTSSLDELDISAMYGQIAEAMKYPADFSSVTFRLNPNARWNDGNPITAEDVVWSFEKSVEINPQIRLYYSHVTGAAVTGEREVTFTFDQPGNRELPHIVGQLTILPKHWWEGKNANGAPRDIAQGTLEPPIGSGAYRIKSFEANRTIVYERVSDWWGATLPVNIGSYNFDEIAYDVYRDSTVVLEAFKGDQYDFRAENSAKNWATGYDFPARIAGRVILEKFPDKATGMMQAFVPNLRREKFQDVRVRRALNLAFDFESMNRTVFFGEYKRSDSFFAGTELASSGLPQGRELEILETVRDLVPPEVFAQPYANPTYTSPQSQREHLREALRLLAEAGYERRDGKLVNASTGEPFTIEFLENDPNAERYVLPYQQALAKLGIALTLRIVDTPQLIARLRSFDFDMSMLAWGQSLSPGNEQKYYWGTGSADEPGSRNYAGIKDPGVDRLIDHVIFAKDRAELIAATHALDRVLLANEFVVPGWYIDLTRTARWDRFGRPANIPPYTTGFPDIWWWDAEKAAKTGGKA